MTSKRLLIEEDNSRKRRPTSKSPIWRYMSIHEALTLLLDRKLMFRQFKGLVRNDRKEGMIPSDFWESLDRAETEIPRNHRTARERGEAKLRTHLHVQYVSCWNWRKTENALMWMSYAPLGIAVKTTIGKLETVLRENKDEVLGVAKEAVIYADDWAELERHGFIHNGQIRSRLFLNLKRNLFRAEQEVRFRIDLRPTNSRDPNPKERPPLSYEQWPQWSPVIFEDLSWIDEIVGDSAIYPWCVDSISNLCKQHKIRFRQSGR